ncbi:putative bifunctional diguanylate cyclase/phosphodiesterase [Rhizosaccharibacter radicis]|uniref:EAL domain-containing protein n=1 Tax=Rhizosaccharibacter radicis TaxID=2782605 RepID=A0ABT1VTL4_9PROT|nr:EAL domain-containing protein [Acetobacteraceae bacterium KSS12]
MKHLLAETIRLAQLPTALLTALIAVCGGVLLTRLLPSDPFSRSSFTSRRIAGVAVALLAMTWGTFRSTFAGAYPRLAFTVPPGSVLTGSALMLGTSVAAGMILGHGRRSARNTMLAGSLLASGASCLIFGAMAGIVRPFSLAYDLPAVLVTTALASACWAFALHEVASCDRPYRRVVCTLLIASSAIILAIGSLGSILPFQGWMTAAVQPDSLASSPVPVVMLAQSLMTLCLGLFGFLVDNRVAARDRLEAERVRQLADSAMEGLVIHRDGRIIDSNVAFATLVGLEHEALRRYPVEALLPAGGDAALWLPAQAIHLRETEIQPWIGSKIPVEILSRPIIHAGSPAIVTALRDLRERRESEQRIRYLAHHDTLTGLPNRANLMQRLDEALSSAEQIRSPVAVFCLDLDGFKAVNDTLGHHGGDELLRSMAERLKNTLRERDFLARLGGDEFVILQSEGAGPEQADVVARRVIDEISRPFAVDGQEVTIGTSIGITLYPQNGDTATALLKQADIALYHAKELGRGVHCFFEPGMDMALRKRRSLERDLRHAMQENELTLHFQPLFDSSQTLVTFEALLRWTHPTLGPIPPTEFIPMAEESGLILALGEWVLRTACRTAIGWQEGYRVAVNLSPIQILRGTMPALVQAILNETGLPSSRLELELTEGMLIHNAEEALEQLVALRQLGVRLVLDDFGTGYSSLSYLHRFPFDKLKVDRTFVQRLESDSSARAIVNAIISMSKNLNLEVTAEGVETLAQFEMLRAQGCHELQGFLLGRPMPETEIRHFQPLFGSQREQTIQQLQLLPDQPMSLRAAELPLEREEALP